MTRPPSMRNRRDVRAGVFHLAAELGALTVLLGIAAALAWLMLLP